MQQTSADGLYLSVPVDRRTSLLGSSGDAVLDVDKLYDRLRNVGVGQYQDKSSVSVQPRNGGAGPDGVITLFLPGTEFSAEVPKDATRAILSATGGVGQADRAAFNFGSSGKIAGGMTDVTRGGETLVIVRGD